MYTLSFARTFLSVLRLNRIGGTITAYSVARIGGISHVTARKYLRKMEAMGMLRHRDLWHRSNAEKTVYRLMTTKLESVIGHDVAIIASLLRDNTSVGDYNSLSSEYDYALEIFAKRRGINNG